VPGGPAMMMGFFFVVFGFQTVLYGNYSLKFFRESALVCVWDS
jgi:hypothetical protein